mmetsp:Transcript_103536/g.194864  ORF Transcript_103536/g.194864 Transcript_103536/m.194864 type:complete len:646 (-) Transcript_103536:159-2096(-)
MFRWTVLPANALFCLLVARAALPFGAEATTADLAEEEAACPNYALGAARAGSDVLTNAEQIKPAAPNLPTSFSLLQRSQNRVQTSQAVNANSSDENSTAVWLPAVTLPVDPEKPMGRTNSSQGISPDLQPPPAAALVATAKQARRENSSERNLSAAPSLATAVATEHADHAQAGAAAAAVGDLARLQAATLQAEDTVATMRVEDKVSAAAGAVEAAAKATEAAEALSAAAWRRPDLSAAELQQVSAAVEDAARAHEVASHQASIAAQAEDELVDAGTGSSQFNAGAGAHANTAAVQLRVHQAAKMKAEAAVAAAEAAAAQAEAQDAATVAQIVKAQQICHWRMPDDCVRSFYYEGQQYFQCVTVGSDRPWCSTTMGFDGAGWLPCNYTCESSGYGALPANDSGTWSDAISTAAASLVPPFIDTQAPLQATAPAASPGASAGGAGDMSDDYLVPVLIPHSMLDSMQQHQDASTGFDVVSSGDTAAASLTLVAKSDSSENVWRGDRAQGKSDREVTDAKFVGASAHEEGRRKAAIRRKRSAGETAELDEAGYMVVVSQRSDHQMAAFVKRMIERLGCRVKHKSGLSGFVPWYSGDRDIQDFLRLERELRCICSLEQFWLEPIDEPPAASAEDCEGTRWTNMVDYDAE